MPSRNEGLPMYSTVTILHMQAVELCQRLAQAGLDEKRRARADRLARLYWRAIARRDRRSRRYM
jgi:hypothetical protein